MSDSPRPDTPPADNPVMTHALNFYSLVTAFMRHVVSMVPQTGAAGHLVQQAEASLNAIRNELNPPPPPPEPDTPEGKQALADQKAAEEALAVYNEALAKAAASRSAAEDAAAAKAAEPPPEPPPEVVAASKQPPPPQIQPTSGQTGATVQTPPVGGFNDNGLGRP